MSPDNTEGTPSDEMRDNHSQPTEEGRDRLFHAPEDFFDPWSAGSAAAPGGASPWNAYPEQFSPAGSGGFDPTAPFPLNQPQGGAGEQNAGPAAMPDSDRTQQWIIDPFGPQPQQNGGQPFNVNPQPTAGSPFNVNPQQTVGPPFNINPMSSVCPACGTAVYNGQQFCPSCGFVLRQANGTVPPGPAAAKKGRTGIIVLSIVCALLLAVTGIFAFKFFQSGTDETTAPPVTETTAPPTTEPTTAPPTTEPTTAPPTTVPPPITTQPPTTAANVNGIPAALQQYADKLVYEGRAYRITLDDAGDKLNYRSEPVYISIRVADNNVLGLLRNGTEIYVEYIYDGKWAVFLRDGKYVFASLYSENDPSQERLMQPE